MLDRNKDKAGRHHHKVLLRAGTMAPLTGSNLTTNDDRWDLSFPFKLGRLVFNSLLLFLRSACHGGHGCEILPNQHGQFVQIRPYLAARFPGIRLSIFFRGREM